MKRIKKFLSLVMILALALSLAGCGSTADKLYGTWSTTFDYSSEFEADIPSEYEGFHEELDITLLIDFNEDGTFKWYLDEAALTDSYTNYLKKLASFVAEKNYEDAEAAGNSRDELEAAFMDNYGMTLEDFLFNELQESIDIESAVSAFETTGVYEAKGNKLYMDEVEVSSNMYDLFTVEGDVLTIDAAGEVDSEEMIEGFEYPFVFNRVQ